jgi:hypothetical protein
VPNRQAVLATRTEQARIARFMGTEYMTTNYESNGHRKAAEEAAIRQVIARMVAQFPELPAAEVERAVYGRYDSFDESSIRDFVPVLIERAIRRQLADERSRRHRA